MSKYSEDTVEQAALLWLQALGHAHVYGPDIAPNQSAAERSSYCDVIPAAVCNFSPKERIIMC